MNARTRPDPDPAVPLPAAEALARLRLARTDGIGPLTFRRLLARHGTARAALAALPSYAATRTTQFAPPPEDAAAREMDALARLGGRYLFAGAADYPPLLALIEDAPPAIALLGDPALLAARTVAVVGARNASAAGRRIAEELAAALGEAAVTVASGLARGVDTAAHQGAIATPGRTIAVVPGGLDTPYPEENARLQAAIAEAGAVVAEAPLGTAPLARHFPRRNRIIAGLSLGVVVVEAAPRSGTLTTARLAVEQGREVFAVPGSPLDPRCRGSNDLIRQGAHLTETVDDVLEHLPEAPRPGPIFVPRRAAAAAAAAAASHPTPPSPPGDSSGQVLELVGNTPTAVDDLLRRCQLSASVVQAILLDLELAGRVEMLPGHRVVLSAAGG